MAKTPNRTTPLALRRTLAFENNNKPPAYNDQANGNYQPNETGKFLKCIHISISPSCSTIAHPNLKALFLRAQ
jgi:hypothetical protein